MTAKNTTTDIEDYALRSLRESLIERALFPNDVDPCAPPITQTIASDLSKPEDLTMQCLNNSIRL